jgi:hypothetical protein
MCRAQDFELFYDDPFDPLPIASFDDFRAAKETMQDFASHVPGQYFVWSHEVDDVVAHLQTGSASRSAWW